MTERTLRLSVGTLSCGGGRVLLVRHLGYERQQGAGELRASPATSPRFLKSLKPL